MDDRLAAHVEVRVETDEASLLGRKGWQYQLPLAILTAGSVAANIPEARVKDCNTELTEIAIVRQEDRLFPSRAQGLDGG